MKHPTAKNLISGNNLIIPTDFKSLECLFTTFTGGQIEFNFNLPFNTYTPCMLVEYKNVEVKAYGATIIVVMGYNHTQFNYVTLSPGNKAVIGKGVYFAILTTIDVAEFSIINPEEARIVDPLQVHALC